MILAEKVVMLRKKNGWSQEELAEKLNVSRQSVSKWEVGAAIPDLDKILKLSEIFDVSTDYLLKDNLNEISFREGDDNQDTGERSISLEEANTYMDVSRNLSGRMANAISLLVISPVCLIVLSYAHYGLTDYMASGLGLAILLILVAIGVSILIQEGMKYSKYEYLEKEVFSLQYGVEGIVEKNRADYEDTHRQRITMGVTLCILSAIPLVVAACFESEWGCIISVGFLLIIVAIGVNLFVRTGIIMGSFERLLQSGDFSQQSKELNQRTSYVSPIYWCTVTAIYLGSSFLTQRWDRTWIIWVVAGVFFAAIMGIANAIASSKEKKTL